MRIDSLLSAKGVFPSRNKAKESVNRGEIYINGKKVEKSSFDVKENDFSDITVKRVATEFVSVGGFKLEKALNDFEFSVDGFICADIGASTGGFTDCLIQRGAKTVYAVDLNDELLSEKLKNNKSVIPIIKNARYLSAKDFPLNIDLIVADLSFISETLVLSVFSEILSAGKHAIILIKPQFEEEGKIKRKNGIVNDDKAIFSAIRKVVLSAVSSDFTPDNLTNSPIVSGKNKEFLLLLTKKTTNNFDIDLFIKNYTLKNTVKK